MLVDSDPAVRSQTATPLTAPIACSAYVGPVGRRYLVALQCPLPGVLGAVATIAVVPTPAPGRSTTPPNMSVELTDTMVEEVTSQAGVFMTFDRFLAMLHSALLRSATGGGSLPRDDPAWVDLQLFVESFPQMKARILGDGVVEGGDAGNGGQAMFLSLDWRGPDGAQALFPIPLAAAPHDHPRPPVAQENVASPTPHQRHLHGDPYYNSPAPSAPPLSQVNQLRHNMIVHTLSPDHHHLQYTPPPKVAYRPVVSPLSTAHNTSVTLSRHPVANGNTVPATPPPKDQYNNRSSQPEVVVGGISQPEAERLKSRIQQLEADNVKLLRENEALAKLTKEKMLSMQAECGEVQRRVVRDQTELKSLRIEVSRLEKDLGRALRERDLANQQLSSANSRIRMMGGSPHRPIRSISATSRPPSVGSRGTSRPPSPVVRANNGSRSSSVDIPRSGRSPASRTAPLRHPVNTSGGSANSGGSTRHAKPWGAGPGRSSPANRRPSPQNQPSRRTNRFDSPAARHTPRSSSPATRPTHHNVSLTSSQCTLDRCNRCGSGRPHSSGNRGPKHPNRFDSPVDNRRRR